MSSLDPYLFFKLRESLGEPPQQLDGDVEIGSICNRSGGAAHTITDFSVVLVEYSEYIHKLPLECPIIQH